MEYPKEAIVKNILSVLFSKKSLLPEERNLFGRTCQELGLSRDEYARYNTEWQKARQANHEELVRGASAEENALILAFMVAGAYFDNVVYSGERETLLRFCKLVSIGTQPIERFLSLAWTFDFSDGVVDDALDIKARLAAGGGLAPGDAAGAANHVTAPLAPPAASPMARPRGLEAYVATQAGREGIDELQALFICSQLGLNAALSGPPGIGKTESVLELARLLELPLFTKTCSARTSESHIISHPVLMERNGVSVTAHEDGALCRAMSAPGIFYGDEYNLLKEDVQKRMNSAFDSRRSIDRNDGSIVQAKPGFMAVISYNPTQDFGKRDLEDSVADRFVHFRFVDWPSDLRAYISTLRADSASAPPFSRFKIELETRGISRSGRLCVLDNEAWVDFFTGMPCPEPEFRYHCLDGSHLSSRKPENATARMRLDSSAMDYATLARTWSQFVDDVNELATTGRSWLIKELGLGDIATEEDFETMLVHRCSTRIISAALSHHRWLVEHGASPYVAQSYCTGLIINQMAYGAFGTYKLRDKANPLVLEGIAKALRLYVNDTIFTTNLPAAEVVEKGQAQRSAASRPSGTPAVTPAAARATRTGPTTKASGRR